MTTMQLIDADAECLTIERLSKATHVGVETIRDCAGRDLLPVPRPQPLSRTPGDQNTHE